jgi:hypothetical protein
MEDWEGECFWRADAAMAGGEGGSWCGRSMVGAVPYVDMRRSDPKRWSWPDDMVAGGGVAPMVDVGMSPPLPRSRSISVISRDGWSEWDSCPCSVGWSSCVPRGSRPKAVQSMSPTTDREPWAKSNESIESSQGESWRELVVAVGRKSCSWLLLVLLRISSMRSESLW